MALKQIPQGKKGKGLSMLPTKVRNNMGFMYGGGMAKKPRMSNMDYRKGGLLVVSIDMKKEGNKINTSWQKRKEYVED